MSRGTLSRRRGGRAPELDEESPIASELIDESDRRAERVDAENARLQDRVVEVEAWYRLLQSDHAALRKKHEQVGRQAARVQAELDRLGLEHRGREAPPGWPESGPGPAATRKDRSTMIRVGNWLKSAREHKWGTALVVALATLVARDPGVQDVFSAALAKVRHGARGDDATRDPASSGYVRYAAMIQARDEVDRIRAEYNDKESTLKGDALLEAQDRLRTAKARHRAARLAFLPELARRCDEARLPVPREASEALAALRRESGE